MAELFIKKVQDIISVADGRGNRNGKIDTPEESSIFMEEVYKVADYNGNNNGKIDSVEEANILMEEASKIQQSNLKQEAAHYRRYEYSESRKNVSRIGGTATGAVTGAALGFSVAGPIGSLVGIFAGGTAGFIGGEIDIFINKKNTARSEKFIDDIHKQYSDFEKEYYRDRGNVDRDAISNDLEVEYNGTWPSPISKEKLEDLEKKYYEGNPQFNQKG